MADIGKPQSVEWWAEQAGRYKAETDQANKERDEFKARAEKAEHDAAQSSAAVTAANQKLTVLAKVQEQCQEQSAALTEANAELKKLRADNERMRGSLKTALKSVTDWAATLSDGLAGG